MENVYAPPSSAARRKALILGLMGLIAFLGAEAILLRSFTRVDTRPPAWDQSIHMEIALDYRQALKAGRPADAWYLAPKPGMPPFPPLYHLLLMRTYDSLNPAHAALWVNWMYLVLLSVSIFGLAWYFRPDSTALAATMMFVASPGIQDLLTTQLVDLPLIALAAAAYWALIASEGFTVWIPSLLFGVLHAAGMLHKWSFFSYMLPAYWVAFMALADRRSAMAMSAAAALSVALTFPWYSAHLALLPSRLVQASADFAVPVWTPGAWAVYFKQASDALGPIFWVLGSIALLAPQFPRRGHQGWILIAWVAFSYVFWTIVPNRQLRFLFPGLVPLGIAFCSTWPKVASWSVTVLQLFSMFNYYAGWIGPVAVNAPFYRLEFFYNRPPKAEEWKTEEILRAVESLRDPARPLTNVTLVANDEYFNAPTFHWTQRRLGLEHVRMRGVNRRLSELSEFVLLKDPKIGPPGVISGLPEAAAVIRDKSSWFNTAYEEVANWPLPDGSTATLFRQRRGLKKPVNGKGLFYQVFNAGKVELTGLKAQFGPWDEKRSTYKNVTVSAKQADIRGLITAGPELELEGVGFVPLYTDADRTNWSDLRVLRLERLKVKSLDIGAEELMIFIPQRVKGLTVTDIVLEKTVRIAGTYKGKSVAAEASIDLLDSPRRLKIDILSASIAGVSLPLSLFREIKELSVPLYPNPETPFDIDLPSLTIKNGRLTVP
jgi:hypothetical protein